MFGKFLHIAGALMLLCAAIIIAWTGIMSGYASFVLLGLWIIYMAFEKAQRAFRP